MVVPVLFGAFFGSSARVPVLLLVFVLVPIPFETDHLSAFLLSLTSQFIHNNKQTTRRVEDVFYIIIQRITVAERKTK